MEISVNNLKKRYSTLSDSELIQLYKTGGLTEEATTVLSEQLAVRGLTIDKIDDVTIKKVDEKKLEGIGGWLICVAIGIVVTPIRIIRLMMTTFTEIFSTGAWETLTTQGSEVYSPLWAPIIIGEMLINSSLMLICLYMIYLFFTKKRHFPKWYIGIAVFSLLFIVADAFATKLVLPDEAIFDPDTVKELMRSVVMVVVWVPYMLVSERVQATFVK